MNACLPDVNVLVALMWPAHEAHAAAQAWFTRMQGRQWVTCPWTEAGFIRTVSNPAFSRQAVTPREALDLLTANVAHSHHVFWPDEISVAEALEPFRSKLAGNGQIADAYLLSLAAHRKGTLVTFDREILTLAAQEIRARKHVELIVIR